MAVVAVAVQMERNSYFLVEKEEEVEVVVVVEEVQLYFEC